MDGEGEVKGAPKHRTTPFKELSLPRSELRQKLESEWGFKKLEISKSSNVSVDFGDGTTVPTFSLDTSENEKTEALYFKRTKLGALTIWKLKNNLQPEQNIEIKSSSTYLLHPDGDINLKSGDILRTNYFVIVLFFDPQTSDNIEFYYSAFSEQNVV